MSVAWKMWGVCLLIFLIPQWGHAKEQTVRTYALIVGNNAPPENNNDTLSTLRYADDDVIRAYRFFSRLTSNVHLLTVPDAESQKRYPSIIDKAELPTLSNIAKVIGTIGSQVAKDKSANRKTVIYLYFSGHGAHSDNGEPALVLLGGNLTRTALYRDIIQQLPADYIHLFVDACYAEGVVGSRGIFDKEVEGKQVSLTSEEQNAASMPTPSQFPGLGVFVSSSAAKESHEWSKLESGIFTHEVLSGLSGLADINKDGKIAYSELYAFISAANRNISNPKGRIQVIATPPARNQNEPIVDILRIANSGTLNGDLSELGHFHIELENGERYLDGHMGKVPLSRVSLPAQIPLFLRNKQTEARFQLAQNEQLETSSLTFTPIERMAKGSMDTALAKGLFSSPFSVDYYQGVVDNSHFLSVPLQSAGLFHGPSSDGTAGPSPENATGQNAPVDTRLKTTNPNIRARKAAAITSFVFAGVGAVLATTFGIIALNGRSDYYDTEIESDENTANAQYTNWGTAAWATAAMIPVGVIAGVLFWPRNKKKKRSVQVNPMTGGDLRLEMTVHF